jgi:ATP-dependent protease ClpP protease subunit
MGKMNLIHHEEVPPQLLEHQVVTIKDKFIGHQIDIRMDSEIGNDESVRPIIKALQEAKWDDTVIFHMAGFGGEVETVENIINNMHASKAHVITIVEAPVYSGHAYISASGDEIIMMPFTYMMFHTSSGYGTDCSTQTGTDRTVSNIEHCQAGLDAHMALVNKILASFKILTGEETVRIMTGHDVYLTADQYKQRSK